MNRIYKTVWNEALAAWVAVQETAKSHGKSASSDTGRGSTVVLDRLGIKKAQRFVPAVMVSTLALAASYASAAPGIYINDGHDTGCTATFDSGNQTGLYALDLKGQTNNGRAWGYWGAGKAANYPTIDGSHFGVGIDNTFRPCFSIENFSLQKVRNVFLMHLIPSL